MKLPDKKRWRQKWSERDAQEILKIAKSFRATYHVSPDGAWEAAEREYVGTRQPIDRKGYLYAR